MGIFQSRTMQIPITDNNDRVSSKIRSLIRIESNNTEFKEELNSSQIRSQGNQFYIKDYIKVLKCDENRNNSS